jgi:thiamine-monophosphate kinase
MGMVKRKRVAGSESEWLERVGKRASKIAAPGLEKGIGDDCAIFRPPAAEDLLFTTDLLVEDTHFRRSTHQAADVGWKALARGLSDIAAMGGEPRFCLLSLSLAPWTDRAWADGFYTGLLLLAARERTPLAGGDLSHGERLVCDIVVCGSVPRNRALRRDGARPGDGIYVSGLLGGSALGLRTGRGNAWKRHARPEPRLELGRFLRTELRATAAMDLSDGLSLDLHRLCRASGTGAEIEAPPVFRGATLDDALHGGEDYELLFTVPRRAKPPGDFQGLRLTRIGTVTSDKSGTVLLAGRPLEPAGYDHLRA